MNTSKGWNYLSALGVLIIDQNSILVTNGLVFRSLSSGMILVIISSHSGGLLTGVVPIKRYWFIEMKC
jgi:hypothetical protein